MIQQIFCAKILINSANRIYGEPYDTTNHIQDSLGYDSLFKGLVVKNWTCIQTQYLQQCNLPNGKNQAKHGIKTYVRTFMTYVQQRWDICNEAAHSTSLSNATFKHNKLMLELKQLHTQKEEILNKDKFLLEKPLLEASWMKTYQLQKLIRQISPIISQSRKEARKLGNKQRRITAYFPSNKRRKTSQINTAEFFSPPKMVPARQPPPEPDPL